MNDMVGVRMVVESGFAWKRATGFAWMRMLEENVSVQPKELFTIRETVNVPEPLYWCEGLGSVLFAPSPKSHFHSAIEPMGIDDLSVNGTISSWQADGCMVKSATGCG